MKLSGRPGRAARIQFHALVMMAAVLRAVDRSTASCRLRRAPEACYHGAMSRIFITGSTDGLGLAAARALTAEGHEVFVHARSEERAAGLSDVLRPFAGVVTGDLSSAEQTRAIAEQVNRIGRMDAVIHNAGIYLERIRGSTPEGHAKVLAVNVLAPYMLTALIERPHRLIYLSSGMHRGASDSLRDIDWSERRWDATAAYSESKLFVIALALAVSRHWPAVLSNAVDPGWVPTRMGGPHAPDDLTQGHLTQTWLAASNDPKAKTGGGYWHHRQRRQPDAAALDVDFQDRLMVELKELTGVSLF